MRVVEVDFQTDLVTQSGNIITDCGSILFENLSTTVTVLLDGKPIAPGSNTSWDTNEGEYITTRPKVEFQSTPPAGELYITRKYYKKIMDI